MIHFHLSAYLNADSYRDFDRYRPKQGGKLSPAEREQLAGLVSSLPQDRHMLLYIWRFVFQIRIDIIRLNDPIAHANGVIEALRFACKRYLMREEPIPDSEMQRVFQLVLPELELVLIFAKQGICWVRSIEIPAALVQPALEEYNRKNSKPAR